MLVILFRAVNLSGDGGRVEDVNRNRAGVTAVRGGSALANKMEGKKNVPGHI